MKGPMLKQQPQLSVSITLSVDTITAVRRQIKGCEICSPQANLPFAELIVRLTGRHDLSENCVMSEDIDCPCCMNSLEADTLVDIPLGIGRAAVMSVSY
jgi:hypothetical protein